MELEQECRKTSSSTDLLTATATSLSRVIWLISPCRLSKALLSFSHEESTSEIFSSSLFQVLDWTPSPACTFAEKQSFWTDVLRHSLSVCVCLMLEVRGRRLQTTYLFCRDFFTAPQGILQFLFQLVIRLCKNGLLMSDRPDF